MNSFVSLTFLRGYLLSILYLLPLKIAKKNKNGQGKREPVHTIVNLIVSQPGARKQYVPLCFFWFCFFLLLLRHGLCVVKTVTPFVSRKKKGIILDRQSISVPCPLLFFVSTYYSIFFCCCRRPDVDIREYRSDIMQTKATSAKINK